MQQESFQVAVLTAADARRFLGSYPEGKSREASTGECLSLQLPMWNGGACTGKREGDFSVSWKVAPRMDPR